MHHQTKLNLPNRFLLLLSMFCAISAFGQRSDTVSFGTTPEKDSIRYLRPHWHSPITQLPHTFSYSAKEAFSGKSLPVWGAIVGSSLLFYAFDQKFLDGVQQFTNHVGIDPERKYKNIIAFNVGKNTVPVYQAPQNINTAFYSVGEGFTSVMICAGLLTHGLIKHNVRSLSTASQIMQAQLAVGFTAQLLKRLTGRESPFESTAPRGVWTPLVSPVTYQHHVPKYDAFPSGHMATMVATVVVLTNNYPEKKWIKYVGYPLIAIVGVAMVNNGVHWMSDYPLAIGMGYLYAKTAVRMNRWIKGRPRR